MDEAVEDFLEFPLAQFPFTSFLGLLELVSFKNLLVHLKIMNTERVIATIILTVSVIISIMLGGNLLFALILNLKYIKKYIYENIILKI